MSPDAAQDEVQPTSRPVNVNWFTTERPVEGGTVFVTPHADERRSDDDQAPTVP